MLRTRALLVALMTATLLLPVLPAEAANRRVEVYPTTGDSVVTLTGRGYGHGHGLSQYGAQGAASQGYTWQQIVEFYYPGTTWGAITGRMRVLISADTTSDVQVVAQRGIKVKSLERRRTWRLPSKGARKWRLLPSGSRTKVQFTKGWGWRTWKQFRGEGELSSTRGPLSLVTPAGTSDYRGKLRSDERDTVNVLPMESYLRGVVPEEVPPLWEPHAVAAQSVAARTYAAAERSNPTAAHYDLCDTSHCQVYGGVGVEHEAATAAIRMTEGQGLYYDGVPAFTQFSASNGGWSSAGSTPYLVAQTDPFDGYAEWTFTTNDASLEQHWPAIGDLTSIEVTSRDGNGAWGGRVLAMSLVGTTGRADISGDDLRTVLGLKSEWFTFTVTPKLQGRRLDP
ncbi:SpoIID/LytB domain-containing protein [Nocardioides seonyuensis]|uniref:SpoIID/LytB domain-containing protein n=1 Tax=Nocardioides seonyuensis TaxID=2518371 RepID=A0A4P7IG51_9ACTN|nr:SpoIID/LytB domain-containing protein [Nocardioides seonyuensis]QBX56265.1 SpoIID/LytB domain-containing protein [Nocardioides seonyuensis]